MHKEYAIRTCGCETVEPRTLAYFEMKSPSCDVTSLSLWTLWRWYVLGCTQEPPLQILEQVHHPVFEGSGDGTLGSSADRGMVSRGLVQIIGSGLENGMFNCYLANTWASAKQQMQIEKSTHSASMRPTEE
jgi:hypothetical protein